MQQSIIQNQNYFICIINNQTNMWNLTCSNNLYEKKARYAAHIRHLKALQAVKSTINNSSPYKPAFLQSKQKTKLIRLQRSEQIQNNNNILVKHMQRIQPTVEDHNDVYYRVKSINQSRPFKRLQQRWIDQGNEMMIKKLHQAGSNYNVDSLLRQTESHMIYKNNIMTSNRFSSRPFSAKSRPASAPNRRSRK